MEFKPTPTPDPDESQTLIDWSLAEGRALHTNPSVTF